jgi:hypothetical protein
MTSRADVRRPHPHLRPLRRAGSRGTCASCRCAGAKLAPLEKSRRPVRSGGLTRRCSPHRPRAAVRHHHLPRTAQKTSHLNDMCECWHVDDGMNPSFFSVCSLYCIPFLRFSPHAFVTHRSASLAYILFDLIVFSQRMTQPLRMTPLDRGSRMGSLTDAPGGPDLT